MVCDASTGGITRTSTQILTNITTRSVRPTPAFAMADETFTNRRGMGCEKKQQVSPSDEAVDAFGPVLMEGPAKRQGEGWKGMKPWNDRFAAAQASARASSLLLRLTSPAPVSPHSFGGGSWGRFLVLRSSALLCYPKGVQGTPESIWKLEQVARQLVLAHAPLSPTLGARAVRLPARPLSVGATRS